MREEKKNPRGKKQNEWQLLSLDKLFNETHIVITLPNPYDRLFSHIEWALLGTLSAASLKGPILWTRATLV